jgi:hypothetical protein
MKLLATIVSLLHSHRRHCSSLLLPNSVCVRKNSPAEHKKSSPLAGFRYLALGSTRPAPSLRPAARASHPTPSLPVDYSNSKYPLAPA